MFNASIAFARLEALHTVSKMCLASILAACSAQALAINEARLEENVAPQSATSHTDAPTMLERVVSSPLFQPRLSVNLRSYDLGLLVDHELTQNTWAAGGRIGLVTPEWRELISVGAAAYASFPLYARGAVDRTLLVQPDGDALVVPGETYLNLRRGGLNARLFRQLLDAPYLNGNDNRMVPNVFEAYAVRYSSEHLYAAFGQVTRMKTRNSNEYVPMAQVAGVPGGQSGVTAAGVRWRPSERASGNAIVFNNWDVFSTVYVEGEVDSNLSEKTDLRLSAQFTSQRSTGKQLLGAFDTHSGGLKAALSYRHAVLTLAGTTTGSDAGIRSPFGVNPSYLTLMLFTFDRAAERAWLLGLSYRFDELGLLGWSFVLNHCRGHGGRTTIASFDLDRRRETDFTLDYRPASGSLKGLWLRLRYADGMDANLRLQEWRFILNYEVKFER
jgi:hypothetical protein